MSENTSPIVILGTGRCGSTYLQTTLCGVSNVWIWGEHDGILKGLFDWSRLSRDSDALKRFSFPYAQEDPLTTLKRNGTCAAWLSPFDADGIAEAERALLINLFSRRLPAGKTRWGFKEIRYGARSRVPERMIELFPGTKFIHVVRHPRQTISSSVRAWRPGLFAQNQDESERRALVRDAVQTQVDRWKETTNYLENFRLKNPETVMTVQIERLDSLLNGVLDFLEVDPSDVRVDITREVNPAPNKELASELIDEAYRSVALSDRELIETAARVAYGD
jgi:hypothetical protein